MVTIRKYGGGVSEKQYVAECMYINHSFSSCYFHCWITSSVVSKSLLASCISLVKGTEMKATSLKLSTTMLFICSNSYATPINISDYLVGAEPGRSWSCIYTQDTSEEVDSEFGGEATGDTFTTIDNPLDRLILNILLHLVETGTLYLVESDNIFLHFLIHR